MRVRDLGTFATLFVDTPRCERTSESVHHLKRLLSDGEISVLDVDTDGTTILHVRFTTIYKIPKISAEVVSTVCSYKTRFSCRGIPYPLWS